MGDRGVIRSLFGMKYSTVKLTDTVVCFLSLRPAPYRVILSEAAHRVKGRTRQPTIAAQRTPSPRRGASRRDLRCLNVPCNAHRPPGTRTQGGAGRYVILLNKRDPACWRPAWGGVRLRGNDWWSRLIFGGWCYYDEVICSEMTRGGQGRGTKYVWVKWWCGALCGTS